jgi:hypothetical protein
MERRQKLRQQELFGDTAPLRRSKDVNLDGFESGHGNGGEQKKGKTKTKATPTSTSLPPLQQTLGLSAESHFSTDDAMSTSKGVVDGEESRQQDSEPLPTHIAVESWLNSVVSVTAPESFACEDPTFYSEEAASHLKEVQEPEPQDSAVISTSTNSWNAKVVNATPDLAKIGMDRASLLKAGLTKKQIDRMFRALYVYSVGFHDTIREVSSRAPGMENVSSKIWRTYVYLLQECSEGKGNYQMAMSQMNEENREQLSQTKEQCKARVAVAHEEAASLRTEVNKLTQHVVDATNEISDFEKMLYQEGEEAKVAQKALEAARAEAQKAKTTKNQAVHDLQQAQRENNMTNQALSETMRNLQMKTSLLGNAEAKVKTVEESKILLLKKMDSVVQSHEASKKLLLEATAVRENLEYKQKNLEEEISRLMLFITEKERETRGLRTDLVHANDSISQKLALLKRAGEKESTMDRLLTKTAQQIQDEKQETLKYMNLQTETSGNLDKQKSQNKEQGEKMEAMRLEILNLRREKDSLQHDVQEKNRNILMKDEHLKAANRKSESDRQMLNNEKEKNVDLQHKLQKERMQWSSSEDLKRMQGRQTDKMKESIKVLQIKLATVEGQKKKTVEKNEELHTTVRAQKKEIRDLKSEHSKSTNTLTKEHASELKSAVSNHETTTLQLEQLDIHHQRLLDSNKNVVRENKELDRRVDVLEQELSRVVAEAKENCETMDARWDEEVRKLDDEKLAHKFTKMKVKRVCALVDSTEQGLRNFANGAVKIAGRKTRRKTKSMSSDGTSEKFDNDADELNNAVDTATTALDEIEQITKAVVLRLAHQQRQSVNAGRLSAMGISAKRIVSMSPLAETEGRQDEICKQALVENPLELAEPNSPASLGSPMSPMSMGGIEDIVNDAIRLKELETAVNDLNGQVQTLELDKADLEKDIEGLKVRINGVEREYEFNMEELKKEFGIFQAQRNLQAEKDCHVERELRVAAQSASVEVNQRLEESVATCEGLWKDLERLKKDHLWTSRQLDEAKKKMAKQEEDAQKQDAELAQIKEVRSLSVGASSQTEVHITGMGAHSQSPQLKDAGESQLPPSYTRTRTQALLIFLHLFHSDFGTNLRVVKGEMLPFDTKPEEKKTEQQQLRKVCRLVDKVRAYRNRHQVQTVFLLIF